MAEEIKNEEVVEQQQPQQEQQEDFNQFDAFDTKPDFAKGGYANEEEEIENMDFERKPEEDVKPQETQQAEPFSKISFNGNNYDFASKEQLESMAQQGLQLGQQAERIRAYANIVEAAEKNPALGNAIAQIVQQYMQTGQVVPLQVPQAQTPEDYSKEPEQGDDEDYDEYEKRLTEWRENKINYMVEQRVSQMLQQQQQNTQIQRVRAWNAQVTNACQSDPDKADVIARMMNDVYCPPQLRYLADNDANMFMRVYDDIKRGMGKPPFYGAPSLMPQGQQQPAATRVQQPQRKSAPFSESATRGASVAKTQAQTPTQELPDFKKMSDEDFEKFKDSFQFGTFN